MLFATQSFFLLWLALQIYLMEGLTTFINLYVLIIDQRYESFTCQPFNKYYFQFIAFFFPFLFLLFFFFGQNWKKMSFILWSVFCPGQNWMSGPNCCTVTGCCMKCVLGVNRQLTVPTVLSKKQNFRTVHLQDVFFHFPSPINCSLHCAPLALCSVLSYHPLLPLQVLEICLPCQNPNPSGSRHGVSCSLVASTECFRVACMVDA